MAKKERKKRSKTFKVLVGLIIVLGIFELVAFGALAVYISDYYHADAEAEAAMVSTEDVSVFVKDDWVEFVPAHTDADKADTGIIFYPGGKVEYTAYAPLMKEFASEGYFCVVVRMPFNLAVLHTNAAKDVKVTRPEISHWIIGGHSLGGVMAAKYAAISDFDGLFLLAAYANTDLSDKDIAVVSIYGDVDGVLDMEEYEASKSNLPPDLIEQVISGGNHAQFGSYGPQKGDGEATIPAEIQRAQAVQIVLENLTK